MFDLCRLCGVEKCFIDLVDLKECEFNIFRAVDLHCRVILQKNKLLPQNVCKTCVDYVGAFITYSENVKSVQNRFISDLQNIDSSNAQESFNSNAGVSDSEEVEMKVIEIKIESADVATNSPGTSGISNEKTKRKRSNETKKEEKLGSRAKKEKPLPDLEKSDEILINEENFDDIIEEEYIIEEDILEASEDEEFVPEEVIESDEDYEKKKKSPAKKKKVPAKKTTSPADDSFVGANSSRNSIFSSNLFEVIFEDEIHGNFLETPQDFDIPVIYKKNDGTISEDGWHLVSSVKWNDAISTNCVQCDEDFDNIFLLKEHFRTKHSTRAPGLEFTCKSCETKKKFSSLHPIINHVTDQHYMHLKYCCFICNSMFWNFNSLYHHYQMDHPEILTSVVFCLICGIHYYDKRQMQRHRDTHRDGNKSYESIFFKELNTDVSQLENKLGVMESEKNIDGSITEDAIDRLQLTKWQNILIDCSLCDLKNFTILELRDHYEKDHDKAKPRDKIYTCKTGICTFSKSCEKIGGVVVHHILSHDKKLSYGCIVCSKYFWNHVSLHYHYRHAHYQLKPYLCLFCGFFSRDMAQLNRHLLTHNVEGIKKHICEHCGKPFATNSNLKMHVDQVHSEVMAYECKICHHKFKSKYRYRYHIATHTDARPHQCPICKARFKAKVTLNDHYRTHFSERRYGCSHCDKRFHKGHDLKVHERLHTGDFPYSCSVCGERYPAWSNLFKHAKSRHGLDIASQRAKTYRDIKENDEEIPDILKNELC